MNYLLAGVGGQGILLVSKLLASALMKKEDVVYKSDMIGMAQRGGSVVSHVRAGNSVFCPMIPINHADILIGFEPVEAVRNLFYLKRNGVIIVNNSGNECTYISKKNQDNTFLTNYLLDNFPNVIAVDVGIILKRLESEKVANVVLLGIALGCVSNELSLNEMAGAIKDVIPEKYLEINEKALIAGYSFGKKLKKDIGVEQ